MSDEGKIILFGKDLMAIDNESYTVNYDDYDSCCGEVCGQYTSIRFDAIFIPILYSLAVVVGLLGNGLVLGVLWQKRRSWSVTDTFILHLTVADTLLLLTMPLWAVEAAEGWTFGTPLCKITGALFKINFFCGIFLLACISLDRYLSVVHAVQMYSRRKPRLIQLSCIAVWFFSLLLSMPDWKYLQAARDERRGKTECVIWYPSSRWGLAFRILYHVLGFLLPAVVLLYCYCCILVQLQRGSQGVQKQRAIRVILALVLAFFICWTPYNITLLVDTFHTNQMSNNTVNNSSCETTTALDIALTATTTLGYLHCCLNPVLYAFVGVNFRRHLLDMMRPLSSRLKGRVDTVSRKSSAWAESVDTSQTSAF
ncbi:C-X-C chemokine receptor type 3.1 isoform X1 [Electrophorus electricus]|uniref:C-X-C chemokine receptor type 3.1 isoform X1 n=1 Tax=Electrophorus electricus TaxID=8005 RepID=UPI0015CFF0F7|nr:C-X-C chemokine receptor type 3.1 isoform X1 [Electrophorus electricus]